MNTYLITYDLPYSGQKYNCLYKKIEDNFSLIWRCMNNIFIIKTQSNSNAIFNLLSPCIDSNDKLLVIKLETGLNADAKWCGTTEECTNWLKSALILS